jgi:hypothetical protein
VAVSHRDYVAQGDRLRQLAAHMPAFAAGYQVLLAEMIALQAFYFFESAVESIAAKLVCGARYADGVVPTITHAATTIDDALTNMRTIGRPKPKGILKWNKASEITGNVQFVMSTTEHFCIACRTHSARINEIRMVRNHIAHNNPGTRRDYATVVARRLGAAPLRLPRPGVFVLREFTAGTPLLVEYVVTLGAIIRDAAKI